jgi:hypothetical protein
MNTSHNVVRIKRLIWAYFFLIIFEGALRKWVAPGLAGPLLMIRVPVVLAIYILALRTRLFPRGFSMMLFACLSLLSLFAGLSVLPDSPAVAFFGFQATFLHLPLLFIIPRILDRQDIHRIGYWTLLLSMPLAIIMALQFRMPASSWINTGAGEGAHQITFALGHVRASATFSFVSGVVIYYSLVAAFLFWHMFTRGQYPLWIVIGATLATTIAAGVAGSRAIIVSLSIVVAFALIIVIFLQPHLALRWVRGACLIALVGLLVLQIPVFNDGLDALSVRLAQASRAEGDSDSVFQMRILAPLIGPFADIDSIPLLGYGLGMGTNAAGALTSGSATHDLENWEWEWGRNISESGPILGLSFIIYRTWLVGMLLFFSFRRARRGNVLPLLLFSTCANWILNGNFGQATVVGFSVFIGGLCLASMGMQTASQDAARTASPPLRTLSSVA